MTGHEGKGFAGLQSLLSNVDDELASDRAPLVSPVVPKVSASPAESGAHEGTYHFRPQSLATPSPGDRTALRTERGPANFVPHAKKLHVGASGNALLEETRRCISIVLISALRSVPLARDIRSLAQALNVETLTRSSVKASMNIWELAYRATYGVMLGLAHHFPLDWFEPIDLIAEHFLANDLQLSRPLARDVVQSMRRTVNGTTSGQPVIEAAITAALEYMQGHQTAVLQRLSARVFDVEAFRAPPS
jgi:hypothetical protein